MEFITDLGLFLFKAIIIIGALVIIVAIITSSGGKAAPRGRLKIRSLNEDAENNIDTMQSSLLNKADFKQQIKQKRKIKKQKEKASKHKKTDKNKNEEPVQGINYVIDFNGDIKASAVTSLREEISALLVVAKSSDEVIVRLESPGGVVHGYGLAASQLDRIRKKGIHLTIAVDKVAASGGYMMACIGNRILAAPFAILGSVGVIAQLPNFNKLLKKHDVDIEMHTAGKYKRTLTVLGENTQKGREKFIEELQDMHTLFKEFVEERRPEVNIEEVATGEIWYGRRALDKKLIDDIKTSDEYIADKIAGGEKVYHVQWERKKTVVDKLANSTARAVTYEISNWWSKINNRHYF